jgi:hypothetical protein
MPVVHGRSISSGTSGPARLVPPYPYGWSLEWISSCILISRRRQSGMIGVTLGHYKILGLLGKGGVG